MCKIHQIICQKQLEKGIIKSLNLLFRTESYTHNACTRKQCWFYCTETCTLFIYFCVFSSFFLHFDTQHIYKRYIHSQWWSLYIICDVVLDAWEMYIHRQDRFNDIMIVAWHICKFPLLKLHRYHICLGS